jgi:hypothetical protein
VGQADGEGDVTPGSDPPWAHRGADRASDAAGGSP